MISTGIATESQTPNIDGVANLVHSHQTKANPVTTSWFPRWMPAGLQWAYFAMQHWKVQPPFAGASR